MDEAGLVRDANTVDKAVKLAMSGRPGRAYLVLSSVATRNKAMASLADDFRKLMSGVSISAIQNAAHAASVLESVSYTPTHLPSKKVQNAFIELQRAVSKLPEVFSNEIKPIIESIKGDAGGVLTPENSQKISNAAAEIRKSLSPNRLISYQKGLPMTPSKDPKEKMVMDAIDSLRETNVPEDRIPGLLTKLRVTKSVEEANMFLAKAPPPAPAVPAPAPAPVQPDQPEKIRPAEEKKEPEKIISPSKEQPKEEPEADPNTTQYPTLKSVGSIMGVLEKAVSNQAFALAGRMTDDGEKATELEVQMVNLFLDFAAKRISNTKTTDEMTRTKVEIEVDALMNEFFEENKARFIDKDGNPLDKEDLQTFARIVAESVSLDV
jgi:hypothetical protein